MSYLLLCVDVSLMVLIWPINRWVMKNGGRTRSIGLAITLTGTILSFCGVIFSGQPFFTGATGLYGFITAAAYDFGFIMIIFYCLKIGPSGATATLNNLGFLFPVLLGIFVFTKGKSVSAAAVAGIACVILSLVLMAFNKTKGEDKAANSKWFKWIVLGWLLSGISMGSQFTATQLSPDTPYTYAFNCNLSAFLILLIVSFAMRDMKPRKVDMVAGAVTGAVNILSTVILFYIIKYIPAFVIYPVIMATPIIIMLIIGHYVYKEKMNRFGWAACIAGVTALVLFNI